MIVKVKKAGSGWRKAHTHVPAHHGKYLLCKHLHYIRLAPARARSRLKYMNFFPPPHT
jgi:hypothetical protein